MSVRLNLRFDMRAPAFGAPAAHLYPAAVELCETADRAGFDTVYLAEHHGVEDGYCPSPLVLASAIFGRTNRIRVHFSALVAVLHHPLRLAEDLAVLDLVSAGRVEMTLGIGYRDQEYAMFDVQRSKRVKILEEIVGVLQQAWTGEPFDFGGLTVTVRPVPVQRPRPPIFIGGSTEASALRAARIGDNYMPATPNLFEVYAAERRRLGLPVPEGPRPKGPLFLFVSDDPDRDWPIVAPHVMYTSNANAQWARERGVGATPYPEVADLAALKQNDRFAVVTPDECVALVDKIGPEADLTIHPLMGGLPPDIGAGSLELFIAAVLPQLEARGLWTRQVAS